MNALAKIYKSKELHYPNWLIMQYESRQ
jgi:hypothetical protein